MTGMLLPSTFLFTNVPADMEAAFNAAIRASRFKFDRAGLQVQIGYTDAPPGKDAFDWSIKPREGDLPLCFLTLRRIADANAFNEAVIHTLGHFFFEQNGGVERICGWFAHRDTGARATADDWSPPAWDLRVQEAIAEFFKDVYLPQRASDQRTFWEFDQGAFADFVQVVDDVVCPPSPS